MSDIKSLLIVDDDEINRSVLSDLFEQEYNITEADNGNDALKIMLEKKDELAAVLLDVIMPNMDGIEVIKQLREENTDFDVPIILITGDDKVSTLETSYDLGVADVIYKPFIRYVVKRRVDNVAELYICKRKLAELMGQKA